MALRTPEVATAEKSDSAKRLVNCVSALLAAAGIAPSTINYSAQINRYNLSSMYPNATALGEGLYENGANVDPSQNGQRAVLWFEKDGGGFIQHSYDPKAANGACQGDKMAWQTGRGLVYSETYDYCGPVQKRFSYDEGIVFAPPSWQAGQNWSRSGVTNTTEFENGVAVCEGTNNWHSYVVGEMTLPDGMVALHTHTTESQKWLAIAGAPESDLCPPGQDGSYKWNENFYFSKAIPVLDNKGAVIGFLPGLARSFGGNAQRPGGTHWDVVLNSWQK